MASRPNCKENGKGLQRIQQKDEGLYLRRGTSYSPGNPHQHPGKNPPRQGKLRMLRAKKTLSRRRRLRLFRRNRKLCNGRNKCLCKNHGAPLVFLDGSFWTKFYLLYHFVLWLIRPNVCLRHRRRLKLRTFVLVAKSALP